MKTTIAVLLIIAISGAFLKGADLGAHGSSDPGPPAAAKNADPWPKTERSKVGTSPSGDSVENTWELTRVDCPHWLESLTDRSLRVDAGGRPHVAYGHAHAGAGGASSIPAADPEAIATTTAWIGSNAAPGVTSPGTQP